MRMELRDRLAGAAVCRGDCDIEVRVRRQQTQQLAARIPAPAGHRHPRAHMSDPSSPRLWLASLNDYADIRLTMQMQAGWSNWQASDVSLAPWQCAERRHDGVVPVGLTACAH